MDILIVDQHPRVGRRESPRQWAWNWQLTEGLWMPKEWRRGTKHLSARRCGFGDGSWFRISIPEGEKKKRWQFLSECVNPYQSSSKSTTGVHFCMHLESIKVT